MRLGIVTHYYESSNYGGNLQAYSLCKFLEKVGHDARQVSLRLDFEKLGEHATKSSVLAKVFKHIKKDFLPKAIDYTIIKFSKAKVLRWTKKQRKSFESFSKAEIPHTTTVFLKENIEACVDEFDIFITGSDQVWNPVYYMPAFFLTFVPPAKRKISYAASVATEKLTAEQASIFKEHLKDFYAISKKVAELIEAKWPNVFTTNIRKSERKGKIFIDYLRNNKGSTCVAPYSIRVRDNATISMPISWKDINKIKPNEITIKNYKKYLNNSWKDYFKSNQTIQNS